MTDPMDALVSLQAALKAGEVRLRACEVHSDVKVLLDHPMGQHRFTYVKVVAGVVQSIALCVLAEPVNGVPCIALGYAVVESMRGRGLAREIVEKAIDEMLNGLRRNGIREFYVEAVVATSNIASNRLARRLISDSPTPGTDAVSGEKIFQYLRLIK